MPETAEAPLVDDEAPTEIPQPPTPAPDPRLIGEREKPPAAVSDAPSPAPEAPRVDVKPETLALVQAVFPTFEQMMRKPIATDDIDFELPQEDGTTLTCKAHLEAIDGPSYDALQSKFPPSAVQRARGQAFDTDKFGPALLARVVKAPSFTEEQWTQLWSNPRWSGGEISSLFWAANGLCLRGLNVPLRSAG